jgi:hypothetical protein
MFIPFHLTLLHPTLTSAGFAERTLDVQLVQTSCGTDCR